MTVAQDKTSVGSGSMEWQTPPELFAWLDNRFEFSYDAFATHENALCRMHSTIEGTFYALGLKPEPSHERYQEQMSTKDGLAYAWFDQRVFMNPPYSRGLIEKCVEKAWSERNNAQIIVALLPASTETRWFQQHIIPYCHIEFLPGRVHFIDPTTGQPGGSPPSGSIIAIFKQDMP
jgi:hypothetical protein